VNSFSQKYNENLNKAKEKQEYYNSMVDVKTKAMYKVIQKNVDGVNLKIEKEKIRKHEKRVKYFITH
jgi:hypothetical protein